MVEKEDECVVWLRVGCVSECGMAVCRLRVGCVRWVCVVSHAYACAACGGWAWVQLCVKVRGGHMHMCPLGWWREGGTSSVTMSLLLRLYPRPVWGSWCRPFLRKEGEGIHLGICVQTDCQVSAGRSEFRAGATRHAVFGRGRVETAPSCGGSCFELGQSQTWPHVLPGCVGHWHADKPRGPAELRGELCRPWLKLTVHLDPQVQGALFACRGEAVHLGPRLPTGGRDSLSPVYYHTLWINMQGSSFPVFSFRNPLHWGQPHSKF